MVTGASWVHVKPRKTKIGQKQSRHFSTELFNCCNNILMVVFQLFMFQLGVLQALRLNLNCALTFTKAEPFILFMSFKKGLFKGFGGKQQSQHHFIH